MSAPVKSAEKQRGRCFVRGQSGNPAGRPKGARSKTVQLLQELLSAGADEVVAAIVADAKSGNIASAKFLLERVVPVPVDRPVSILLPFADNAAGLIKAGAAILQAVGAGQITPSEAAALMTLIDRQRRLVEIADLELRIARLESEQCQ